MTEPTDPGTRTEYAVRYDAPADFKGVITDIRNARVLAQFAAQRVSDDAHGEYQCTVVQRQVTYGEWTEAQE